jgi:hypothetical protein
MVSVAYLFCTPNEVDLDAEPLYSYEGAFQIQNLILGKAIIGLSAFI